MNNLLLALLDVSTSVDAAEAATSSGGFDVFGLTLSNPITAIIIYVGVILIFMYVLSIRPRKNTEEAVDNMRKSVQIGDPVLMASGMFGKVVDITAECFIVEIGLNKGVRVPVLKDDIMNIREPNLSNKEIEVETPEKKGFFSKIFG